MSDESGGYVLPDAIARRTDLSSDAKLLYAYALRYGLFPDPGLDRDPASVAAALGMSEMRFARTAAECRQVLWPHEAKTVQS
jgi:hypothetical protein